MECANVTVSVEGSQKTLDLSLSGVIGQLLVPAVCAFGIVGNLLNLAILTRRKLQKSFRTLEQAANLCLISLAVSDLMFCVFAFLTMFLPADCVYREYGILLLYGAYSVVIINVFIMWSTMLTVAMSLERYLAICFPLRQDIYLTTSRIKYVIVFTFIFSVTFNIPVMWRKEVIKVCSNHINGATANTTDHIPSPVTITNNDLSNVFLKTTDAIMTYIQTRSSIMFNESMNADKMSIHKHKLILQGNPRLVSSSHRPLLHSLSPFSHHSESSRSLTQLHEQKNDSSSTNVTPLYTTRMVPLGGSYVYDTTYRIVWAFVGNFIPLLLLFYFNFCLCMKIYRSYKLQKQLGRQVRARSSSYILTVTLVAIVVLFFILVAPSEVTLQISHLTIGQDTPLRNNIEAVLNLMQSINFSVNFILYCIISPNFRKMLKSMITCGRFKFYRVSKRWKKDFQTSLL